MAEDRLELNGPGSRGRLVVDRQQRHEYFRDTKAPFWSPKKTFSAKMAFWLNTPRRPWEASGTSGMKVLVNGGINLSELDGWWVEAYRRWGGRWAMARNTATIWPGTRPKPQHSTSCSPPTVTRPTPETCESFCARIE